MEEWSVISGMEMETVSNMYFRRITMPLLMMVPDTVIVMMRRTG